MNEKALKDFLNQNKIAMFAVELGKVKDSSRSLILITNGFLELLIETLIKYRCKSAKKILEDSRSFPYSSKLLILNEIGVLPENLFEKLDWFRKLRNKAAHEPFFEVDERTFQNLNYEDIRKPEELYQLCLYLVADVWDANKDVLTPVFAPAVSDSDQMSNKRDAPEL